MGYILALDASTKSTGYAVFNGKELVDYGCITASSTDVIKRIQKMVKGVDELLSKYDIDTMILEEVRPDGPAAKNINTHKALMYLQAAFAFLTHEQYSKVKTEYVYPSEWRAKCGIKNGRGIKREQAKQLDIEFVKTTYGITVNDDAADAIGIGHAYINQLPSEISWGI